LPAWGWQTDADLRVTQCAPRIRRWTGLDPAHRIGSPILPVSGENMDADPATARLRAMLEQRRDIPLTGFSAMLRARPTLLAIAATPRFHSDGTFFGYTGMTLSVDSLDDELHQSGLGFAITDGVRTEITRRSQEAREARRLLEEVINAMGEGLMVTSGTEVTDPDNCIVMTNPAYRTMFSMTEADTRPGIRLTDFTQKVAAEGVAFENPGGVDAVNDALARGDSVLMHLPKKNRSLYVKATHRPTGAMFWSIPM
jgi:PAS domain-containing protein